MPTAKKVTAPPRPSANGVRAPTGSVLSEVIPVSQLEDDFIRATIYGENRVGKTTLACQFPKPLLLLAFEPNKTGGAASVKKMEGVNYLRVTESAKAVRLAGELKINNPFKTVVIDSATSLQDLVLKEIMGPTMPEILSWGVVSRDQYRERSERTRETLRPFFDLDCHTVVLAKMKDHNRQEGDKPKIIAGLKLESFYGADLGGATAGWLHDCSDCLVHLTVEAETKSVEYGEGDSKVVMNEPTGRMLRRLRCQYHVNFAAGLRSATPNAVPEYIDEPTYDKIRAVIDGRPIPRK